MSRTGWPTRFQGLSVPISTQIPPIRPRTMPLLARKSGTPLNGRITAFVAGIGTGGTISGTARYLKEQNPNIKIIGADPPGSVYSGDAPRPYKVEGIGMELFPENYNAAVVDEVIRVDDRTSFYLARRLAREEGILVGGSSGTALGAALSYARQLTPQDVVVVLFPDTGRGYLSKQFNDTWMRENDMLVQAESSSPRCTTFSPIAATIHAVCHWW